IIYTRPASFRPVSSKGPAHAQPRVGFPPAREAGLAVEADRDCSSEVEVQAQLPARAETAGDRVVVHEPHGRLDEMDSRDAETPYAQPGIGPELAGEVRIEARACEHVAVAYSADAERPAAERELEREARFEPVLQGEPVAPCHLRPEAPVEQVGLLCERVAPAALGGQAPGGLELFTHEVEALSLRQLEGSREQQLLLFEVDVVLAWLEPQLDP